MTNQFETYMRGAADAYPDVQVRTLLHLYDLAQQDFPSVRRLIQTETSIIPAIKEYRALTHASLAESKAAVERLRDEMSGAQP